VKKIVFDSYVFISLFRKDPGYEQIRDLLVKMTNDESEGYITAVNLGEVYYMISRKSSTKYAETAIAAIKQMPVHIVEPELKLCLEAAAIKAKYSLSYADAFAAALTINKRAVLLTGDKEFDSLKDVIGFKVEYL